MDLYHRDEEDSSPSFLPPNPHSRLPASPPAAPQNVHEDADAGGMKSACVCVCVWQENEVRKTKTSGFV